MQQSTSVTIIEDIPKNLLDLSQFSNNDSRISDSKCSDPLNVSKKSTGAPELTPVKEKRVTNINNSKDNIGPKYQL